MIYGLICHKIVMDCFWNNNGIKNGGLLLEVSGKDEWAALCQHCSYNTKAQTFSTVLNVCSLPALTKKKGL